MPSCNCREAVGILEEALELGEIQGSELTIEQVVVTDVDGATTTADAQYSTLPGTVTGPDGVLKAELVPETRSPWTRPDQGRGSLARVEVLSG